MQTFAARPIHRPRPTPEASIFEVTVPDKPLPLEPGLQEGFDGTLEQIDAALTQEAIGKISLDAEIYTANRPSLASDLAAETEASKAFYRFIGKPCVQESLGHSPRPEAGVGSGLTLAQSVIEARKGNKEAEARIDINIATATCEAFFKERHITRIRKQLTETGDIVQFGLTTEQIQEDALVHRPHRQSALKDFTLAEARNGLREQQLARDGELDDAWFVAVSFVPRDMPEDWLDHNGDGYFTRTMTYSLQGTTKNGTELIGETVFDKGTNAPEEASYEARQAGRFDLRAYQKVCEWLGLPVPASEREALENPLIVSKALMPNGMLDFWRWMDTAADRIRGDAIVRTVEEYIARDLESREREASLADVQLRIKHELTTIENFENSFEHDIEVNELLGELIRKHGYRESARNHHIQQYAFGVKAAHKLRVAKNLISLGENEEAERWVESGLLDAAVTMCGGGACGLKDVDPASPEFAKAKSMLDFQEGDSITRDEERSCVKCGNLGSVVYVYNANKVNKGCMDCGAVEIGVKKQ